MWPTLFKQQNRVTTQSTSRKQKQHQRSLQYSPKIIIQEWTPTITPTDDKQLLANEFNEFFVTKVWTIMSNLQPSDDNPIDPTYIESDYLTKVRFNTFQKVTEDQIAKPVQKSTTKL